MVVAGASVVEPAVDALDSELATTGASVVDTGASVDNEVSDSRSSSADEDVDVSADEVAETVVDEVVVEVLPVPLPPSSGMQSSVQQ